MNAIKTGIHAKSLVLPSEKLADLHQLIDEYYQRHCPASPEARLFVDDLIYCEWTLRRLRTAETQLYQYQNNSVYSDNEKYPHGKAGSCNPNSFSKLQYRVDATRRAIHRTLQALEQLKAAPALTPPAEPADPPSLPPSPQTTSPQIGFVPAIPAAAPPQPDARTRQLPNLHAAHTFQSPVGLTLRGMMDVDGVLQPVPAGSRSFESFPVDR